MADNGKNAGAARWNASRSTGVPGLDDVLGGGLTENRLFLVEGSPGSGKTTLSLQFLRDGVARGETVLYVALSESLDELHASAASHGWDLEGITLYELPLRGIQESDNRYTMFHPAEIELAETATMVLAEADRVKPSRLVFDSLSELRLLAENPLRYRRQILALKQHFTKREMTVILVDDRVGEERDTDLHSLAHGVITLERKESDYGSLRRRLSVGKLRGRKFREGFHDFAIRKGGLEVFPRLVAAEHHDSFTDESLSSGLPSVDSLLGGGLTRGTSTLLLGPSGTGKSSLATQFAAHNARTGRHVATFLFEESMATYLMRARGLGAGLEPLIESGKMSVRQVDPAELSPGEFAGLVRDEVEKQGANMIVIDSLTGYLNAMPSENFLKLHLHELLTYLGQNGVSTIMTLTQHGIVTGAEQSPIDASYLADTVILLRYFEAFGEVRQALSVIKKRTGVHERTIRELRLDKGIHVGEPVREFHGVLTGVPQAVGAFGEGRGGA
jgi:circadian clock protein KaiC